MATFLCSDTVIRLVRKPGHPWDGRAVVVPPWGSVPGIPVGWEPDEHTCELPEEQALPHGKRMVCRFGREELLLLSIERQDQIAGTLGLRREALPYRGE